VSAPCRRRRQMCWIGEQMSVFTPKALHNTAQGRVSAPWEKKRDRFIYPEGVAQSQFRPLCNPFGVGHGGKALFPGCAGATLGWVVKRLRRRANLGLQCLWRKNVLFYRAV